jgi:cobalt/nickel transport protein
MRNLKSKAKWNSWLLVLGVVVLTLSPLIIRPDAEFGGSDNQGLEAIKEIQPEYKPWFNPLFEISSSEVQSMLFAVQAAAGAGVIGYVIGLYRGRMEGESKHSKYNENSD